LSRYFVTGATGFIGSELVKQLIGRNHQVVALVRSVEKATLLKALGVELHIGDIRTPDTFRAAMRGADGVFHVAAWYRIGVKEPDAERINVDGTRNVLEAARDLNIPRIVYTSTVGVFGDTRGHLVDETYYAEGPFVTEYDRTKWVAHYQVAVPMIRAGMPVMIAMPGLVYGPGDTSSVRGTLAQLLRGRLYVVPRGATFCWATVEDTARGMRLIMETGRLGESYLLTGPVHTFDAAIDLAAQISSKRKPYVYLPPAVTRTLAAVTGFAERLDFKPRVSSEALRLMAGTTWIASPAKAEKELGFTARPLEEGLRHTIEHEFRQLGMA
jgi:nucleoside-diphosphate-sugar epimerase